MSRKVGVEIDLDLETNEYDIRFKKLSKDEDFEMDYWKLREIIDKVLYSVDKDVSERNDTLQTFTVN